MMGYLSGDISEKDQQHFFELLKSNADLKMRFDEMLKVRSVAFIPQLETEKQANYRRLMMQINEVAPTVGGSHSWTNSFLRIAAILILLVSVSISTFYVYKDLTSNDTALCYETVVPVGSQTKIILPDSTVVWLNSGSTLRYNQAFGKNSREVTLMGEGYFEVSKNKKKPFTVHTGMLDINDIGTIFNVKSYAEEKEIIVHLIEGAVNVSLPDNKDVGSFAMKPNDRLVYNKTTKKINYLQTDASRSALWTTGKLCFVDATIEQISKDLERKYNVRILILNEKIKSELFSGSINMNLPLKDIFLYIDVDKKFKISQVGDTININ